MSIRDDMMKYCVWDWTNENKTSKNHFIFNICTHHHTQSHIPVCLSGSVVLFTFATFPAQKSANNGDNRINIQVAGENIGKYRQSSGSSVKSRTHAQTPSNPSAKYHFFNYQNWCIPEKNRNGCPLLEVCVDFFETQYWETILVDELGEKC